MFSLIGYNCGAGARIHECKKGFASLRKWQLLEKLQQDCIYEDTITLDDSGDDLQVTINACNALYKQVKKALDDGRFPITIGGDHSMAIGTWSAIADYYSIKQNLGLLWIDAHLDAHTPDTSPSNAIHGMPAACLLGYGFDKLVNLGSSGAKINPKHIVYVGIRSFEKEEYDLLQKLGVRIFTMNDITQKGLKNVVQDAISIVTTGTDGFGITVDLDAFDPERVPGVGSPEKNGLLRKEVFSALKGVGNHEKIKALEIAEYNPDLGHDDITKQVVLNLITSIFS